MLQHTASFTSYCIFTKSLNEKKLTQVFTRIYILCEKKAFFFSPFNLMISVIRHTNCSICTGLSSFVIRYITSPICSGYTEYCNSSGTNTILFHSIFIHFILRQSLNEFIFHFGNSACHLSDMYSINEY